MPASYLRTFLATWLLAWSAHATTGYLVDPWDQFGSDLVEPLVVRSGLEKLRLLEGRAEPPLTLILGSSTAVTLRTADAEAAGFPSPFNAAMVGSTLRDAKEILLRALARDAAPGRVVIFVDLHNLQDDFDVDQLQVGAGGKDSRGASVGGVVASSLNRDHSVDTYRALARALAGSPERGTAPSFDERGDPLGPIPLDARAEISQRLEGIRANVAVYDGEPPSDIVAQQFLDWVGEAARHVQVDLVLAPLNPELLDWAQGAGVDVQGQLAEARALLAPACAMAGVSFHDLAAPPLLKPEDFRDGLHFVRDAGPDVWQAIGSKSQLVCSG